MECSGNAEIHHGGKFNKRECENKISKIKTKILTEQSPSKSIKIKNRMFEN